MWIFVDFFVIGLEENILNGNENDSEEEVEESVTKVHPNEAETKGQTVKISDASEAVTAEETAADTSENVKRDSINPVTKGAMLEDKLPGDVFENVEIVTRQETVP